MGSYLVMLPVLALVLGWFAVSTPVVRPALAADADLHLEATVTRAIDGSSLDAHVLGARTALGYVGADVLPPNEPCGREALERNRELAGSQVLLEDDPLYQFDDRGRRLYYAFTPDGRSIEGVLIREGLARAARTDGSHGAEFLALELEAKAAGQGCLWNAL
jgi:endonuclease YncB( thermonuclease family)